MQPVTVQLHPFGHGGDLLTAAAAAGVRAEDILDFSANINPLGPPAGLYTFLAGHLPAITGYPDPACRLLCEAAYHRYRPNHQIIPGNGAGELIYLLMRALPPGPVLLPVPSFALYEKAARAAGREVCYHFLRHDAEYALHTGVLCEEIATTRPAVVMLCNPNNPTGCLLNRDDILTVAEACKRVGAIVVVDEAFLEFCPDWHQRSIISMAPENVLVLSSMTKLYAIPGLRLGFLFAPETISKDLLNLRDPWSVNTLAQLAGTYSLRDEAFVERTVKEVAQLSRCLTASLCATEGIRVFPPAANYIFMETKVPSNEIQQRLLTHKILVRDCSNYTGLNNYFIRVAVRREDENRMLLHALQAVLKTGGLHEADIDSAR